jgi:hypothetical protein
MFFLDAECWRPALDPLRFNPTTPGCIHGRLREIESIVMLEKVWYTLAQQGSEPSEDDADHVRLDCDDTIADLKLAVKERNTHTLVGIDARNLEVFEYGKTKSRCKPRTKLNNCTSGSDDKPFSIFYPGTAADLAF